MNDPKPRSAAIIREQLADLAAVMASAPKTASLSFGMQVSLASLEKHHKRLIEELLAAEKLESEEFLENAICA